MTAKFLKTYLWAFVAFSFIFVSGAVLGLDWLSTKGNTMPFALNATVLTIFSLPALIGLLAFSFAKIINFKSAKLFRFKFSAIAIDIAIVIVFMIMAVIYIKLREEVSLYVLLDLENPNFLLILFFAVLAAVLVILLKISLIGLKELIAELNWDKLGGKFFLIFYLATLFFSLVAILFAFLFYKHNYNYYSDLSLALVSGIICFTAATALASFLSASADFLNKVSKSISALLLVLFLGVVVFGSVAYFVFSSNGSHYQYFSVSRYYDRTNGNYDDDYYAYAEEVVTEVDDEPDYYEGEEEDFLDENNKLSFLWDNSADDTDSIKAAIKFGLKEFPTDIQAMNSDFDLLKAYEYDRYNYKNKKGGLAYYQIIHYISRHRSEIPLKSLAEAYWSQIKNNIPVKTYKDKKLDEVVDMLLWVYRDLYNENVGEPLLSCYHINEIMLEYHYDWAWEYYPHIKDYVNENELPAMLKTDDGRINQSLTVWAYSFWGRRYYEDNIKDVFDILTKLQQAY